MQTLGILADSSHFHEPLDITGCDYSLLLSQLRQMWLIRMAEEIIADNVTAGKVKTPAHLGIGQEAVAVGVSSHLRNTDRVFGGHRSHAHFLAMGNTVYSLFAEVLGRATGCSKGMGGSQHLYGRDSGFAESVPIVAATIPIAVGAALAAKLDGSDALAVSYFGDGAIEEGAAQESLNLAATMHLPVMFVCENNLFASHMHIKLRQPYDSTTRFAEAHAIPAVAVDGNDVVAVAKAAAIAVERARSNGGPSYIEAVTYRWRGHVGPREDMDVGVQRNADLPIWKQRDPIGRLASALCAAGALSDNAHAQLQHQVRTEIEEAWIEAEASPYPELSALLDLVYAAESRSER